MACTLRPITPKDLNDLMAIIRRTVPNILAFEILAKKRNDAVNLTSIISHMDISLSVVRVLSSYGRNENSSE